MGTVRIKSGARGGLRRLGSLVAAGVLATAQLGLVAGPVTAAGPSLVVAADQPAAVPAGHNWGFDDFFPRTLSVPKGTTIGFDIEGFHTATLLPKGTTAAQDLASSGLIAADAEDTTANPNGSTHTNLVIPNALPIPATGCGTVATPCTFDGKDVVSSGAPLAGPPSGPFVVTIDAPAGTYVFHCRVHPDMVGTLDVLGTGQTGTTPAELAAAAAAQVTDDVAAGHAAEDAASSAASTANPDGSTTWTLTAGTSSPDGRTVILEMLPRNLNILSGDTVKWVARGTNEIHTVTFPTELHSDILALCENGSVDTPATPTVIPPTSPFDFSCGGGPPDEFENGGGNGVTTITTPSTVADAGVIADAGEAAAFGVPGTAFSTETTFHFTGAVAGTYTYLCQVHEGMAGTITIPSAANATPPPTSTVGPARLAQGSGSTGLWALLLLAVALVSLGATVLAGRRRSRR